MKVPIIYGLSDPLTGEVRYIGKTQNELYKRLSGHFKDKNKTYKTHWIASLKKRGLKPHISIIEVCTSENWEEKEKYWISFYKSQGRLTNYLEGGNGLPKGYKHTPEAIEKIRRAARRPNSGKFKKGREWSPKQAQGNWKKVIQYTLEGDLVKEWSGIINAAEETGVNRNSISGCLKGKLSRGGAFQWQAYSENYPLKISMYINKCGNFKNKPII